MEKLLQYGFIGLCAMSLLIFSKLLTNELTREPIRKPGLWTVSVSQIFTLIILIFAYVFESRFSPREIERLRAENESLRERELNFSEQRIELLEKEDEALKLQRELSLNKHNLEQLSIDLLKQKDSIEQLTLQNHAANAERMEQFLEIQKIYFHYPQEGWKERLNQVFKFE